LWLIKTHGTSRTAGSALIAVPTWRGLAEGGWSALKSMG
jgi:hypothetical protein